MSLTKSLINFRKSLKTVPIIAVFPNFHTICEVRIPDDERSPNLEIGIGERVSLDVPFELRISPFLRHSSLGFRHYPEPPQVAGHAVHSQGPPDASSREDFSNDLPVNVGQAPVDAVMAKRQLRVIDSQKVQNGGMEIVAVGRVNRRFVGPFVAFTVAHPSLDSPAGEPAREREWIMVAAFCTLAARHAAELRRPHHDGVLQQSP